MLTDPLILRWLPTVLLNAIETNYSLRSIVTNNY